MPPIAEFGQGLAFGTGLIRDAPGIPPVTAVLTFLRICGVLSCSVEGIFFLMRRSNSTFAILMVVIAVFMAGLSSFAGVAGGGSSLMLAFYWYLVPALPFLILAGIGQIKKNTSNGGLIGAACGAGAAIIVPYLLISISSMNYSGGGANIGLGLLFLAMPLYIPILMGVGYFFGKRTQSKQ